MHYLLKVVSILNDTTQNLVIDGLEDSEEVEQPDQVRIITDSVRKIWGVFDYENDLKQQSCNYFVVNQLVTGFCNVHFDHPLPHLWPLRYVFPQRTQTGEFKAFYPVF